MGRKWNNIKMKKAAQDKLRSQNYTKVLRDITMAVRRAGPEPESNFSLKISLLKARECNVPKDNVEKAIKKGSAEGGENWDEVNYEGYGPEGVAIFVEAATDNPTRTIANVRSAFNKLGGSMGKEGCLQFVFERKAMFYINPKNIDVDAFTMDMIDAGAEDVELDEDIIIVKAETTEFGPIHKKLEELKIVPEESALERLPLNTKEVSNKETYLTILKMVEKLDSDDDVQKVYHNMEFNEAFEE